VACWGLPAVVCLAVYWYGLRSWFLGDDFVWLGIQDRIQAGSSFWYEIFHPAQHGTFRPLSERLFFLVFHWAFGLHALPYRVCVFLTFFADLALLAWVLKRITGSWAVGFWAALLWVVNPAMATEMTWTSGYMQILCGFFLLLAFHFLLRHIETGRWRYYAAQAAVFVAGFLVMETNAVYPLLALGYTFFFARKYVLRTLPLLAVSLVYVALHMALVPKQESGYYAMHIGWRLPSVFWVYWRDAVSPPQAAVVLGLWWRIVPLGVRVMTLALGAFLVWETVRKRFLAAVLFSWFVLLLGPVLPLGGHLQYYYLTLPLMGLAAFGAYALWRGWSRGGLFRLAATALAAEFILISVPLAWQLTRERWQWTQAALEVVSRVAAVHRSQPGKVILLAGVDDGMFQRVIGNNPFPLVGAGRVYLVPEARERIKPVPGMSLDDFTLPAAPAPEEFAQGRFVVLAVDRHMEDITASYARSAPTRPAPLPRKVDLASDLTGPLLGEGWYGSEQTHRWMGKRATLRLGAPAREGARLMLSGGCAPEQVRDGPLRIAVSVDGVALPAASVASCGGKNFELAFDLPPGAARKSRLEIVVEVDRTYRAPGDQRDLGLAFGTIEVENP
jgi:hypothetical protein